MKLWGRNPLRISKACKDKKETVAPYFVALEYTPPFLIVNDSTLGNGDVLRQIQVLDGI
jgi:hypothetical protein